MNSTGDYFMDIRGFPGSLAGKESACNVGNPGSVPGSGRSAGEGQGYTLQYPGWRTPFSIQCMGSQRVGHN